MNLGNERAKMMKKSTLISAIVAGLVGFLAGLIVMLVIYPFIFPPPVLNEKLSYAETKTKVATGMFIHPNPRDPVHYGKGSVAVYKAKNQYEILLNEDFKVGPGPAFHLFLSDAKDIKTERSFKHSRKYDLGALKSFQGSQVYVVPNHINMSKVRSVVVWCVSFSKLITSANLKNN
jgi:hypothetical protein